MEAKLRKILQLIAEAKASSVNQVLNAHLDKANEEMNKALDTINPTVDPPPPPRN